jgi:hypothetical protein
MRELTSTTLSRIAAILRPVVADADPSPPPRALPGARRRWRMTVSSHRGALASRATQAIVSGPEFTVRVASVPCAGSGEFLEVQPRAGLGACRALATAIAGLDGPGPGGRHRPWWADE